MAITKGDNFWTNYSVGFDLTHDGAAGDTITVTNAQLVADLDPSERMYQFLTRSTSTQAQARQRLLGVVAGLSIVEKIPGPYCRTFTFQRSGLITAITLDANTDGSGGMTLTATTGSGVAGVFAVVIVYQHSLTR